MNHNHTKVRVCPECQNIGFYTVRVGPCKGQQVWCSRCHPERRDGREAPDDDRATEARESAEVAQ